MPRKEDHLCVDSALSPAVPTHTSCYVSANRGRSPSQARTHTQGTFSERAVDYSFETSKATFAWKCQSENVIFLNGHVIVTIDMAAITMARHGYPPMQRGLCSFSWKETNHCIDDRVLSWEQREPWWGSQRWKVCCRFWGSVLHFLHTRKLVVRYKTGQGENVTVFNFMAKLLTVGPFGCVLATFADFADELFWMGSLETR